MRGIITIVLSLISVSISYAGYYSPCEIQGVEKRDWYYGKQLQQKIPDSQEGPFIEFNTKNIIGIKEQTSTYFKATYHNNVLQLHPNLKFKFFEDEYEDGFSTLLDITIKFECAQNASESIMFIVRVEDVNDNVPIFDKSVYEYHFGMSIPEDYRLTDILPISVVDKDFSNNRIYFTIEYNTFLRLEYQGRQKNYDENYFTTLKTLTEIKAPFQKEFTIVATDSGTPPRKSTARVVLTVSSNSSRIGSSNHFIFSKAVYVLKYFQLEEPIQLNCPTEVLLQQDAFEKNFKIEVTPNRILKVSVLQPLSKSVRSFITIDLEATCDHITERSTLIIVFAQTTLNHSFTFSNFNLFIVYVSALFGVVIINIKVFYMYFQKHHKKFATSLPL